MRIFHLATDVAWAAAQEAGSYRVSTLGLDLDDVGFIHCSQAEQVVGVHERFYSEVIEPLVLLEIETDLLDVPWRLDEVPGQPLRFPHVYGPITLSAVVSAQPFRPSAST